MPHNAGTRNVIKNQATQGTRMGVVTAAADLTGDRATHVGKVIKTTATNIDFTLPPAAECLSGDIFTFSVGVAASSGGATLKVPGTETVNGGTAGKGLVNTAATDAIGDSLTVYFDGSNWLTIGKVGTWAAES